jgi:hypothetical protein
VILLPSNLTGNRKLKEMDKNAKKQLAAADTVKALTNMTL